MEVDQLDPNSTPMFHSCAVLGKNLHLSEPPCFLQISFIDVCFTYIYKMMAKDEGQRILILLRCIVEIIPMFQGCWEHFKKYTRASAKCKPPSSPPKNSFYGN